MTVAYYLQLRGHHCDVYEADPEQGGMLRYGIPEYRLPKGWMDRELNHVWELGATFKPNMRLGRDFHIADLLDQGYDAIFVGIGCYKSNELGIPGEDADGTVNALENLYNSTRGMPVPRLKGRTWWSSAVGSPPSTARGHRSAGRREVETIVYRRDLKDMPSRTRSTRRSRRARGHLPGRAGPDHDRCQEQGDRRRVPAHEPRRAG